MKTSINKLKGLVDSEDIKIKKTIDFTFVLLLTVMDRLKLLKLDKTYGSKANIIKLLIIGKL